MNVRDGKSNNDKQVKEINFLRYWLGCLERQYGVTEEDFEVYRTALSKHIGHRVNAHDTVARALNDQFTKIGTHPSEELRTLYLDMANLVRSEGLDPQLFTEKANKVQSNLLRQAIQYQLNTFNFPPDIEWVFQNSNDELVCPSCREVEQKALSASEAITVPLHCTSDHGCRCWVHSDAEPPDAEPPDAEPPDAETFTNGDFAELFTSFLNMEDETTKAHRPWWKFWGRARQRQKS